MNRTWTAAFLLVLALSAAACNPSKHAEQQLRRTEKLETLHYASGHTGPKAPQPFLKFHSSRHAAHRQHKGKL